MTEEIELMAMPTPNPNTIKFVVNKVFFESGSLDFPTKEKASGSRLPEKLFDIDGLSGVFLGTNFISISKTDDAGWEDVLEPSTALIKTLLAEEGDIVDPALLETLVADDSHEDDESVLKIKKILDEEIRPAIAMDGGDCQFHSFKDGVLTLMLQGACSTCPASTMTLKMGIESRLKEEVPSLKEVIQLA